MKVILRLLCLSRLRFRSVSRTQTKRNKSFVHAFLVTMRSILWRVIRKPTP